MDDLASPPRTEPEKPPDSPAPGQRRPGGKARPFLLLGALLLLAGAGVAVYLALNAGKESTDDAQIEADVVSLAPRVGGRVERVLVVENQHVHQGDVILQLETADLRARVDKAEADVAIARAEQRSAEANEQIVSAGATGGLHSAQARLSSSRVDVNSAGTQIAVAQASLERAQADAKKAALELGRASALHERGAATSEQLDNAQIADASARATVAQAQAALEVAQAAKDAARSRVAEAAGRVTQSEPIDAQVEAAHAQSELARARVKASEAALELATLDLSYAELKAPTDGIVSTLSARVGQLLSTGQPIAELVPEQSYVVANFKETQIARMRPGDEVEIVLDAYPDRTLHGVVQSLSGGTGARFSLLPPDNASGNYVKVVQRVPVRIEWKGAPEVPVQVGLSAEVTVEVGSGTQARDQGNPPAAVNKNGQP